MSSESSVLIRDQLPSITFNGLNGPAQSWSCGNIRLISDAGSYLERLTSLCGPPEVIAQIVEVVVAATEKSLAERTSDYKPTIGIGWWKGSRWDLMIYMEVSGEGQPAVALVDVLNAHPDLLQQVYVLRGVDHPLFGCADTIWTLLEIGHERPELREEAFGLALTMCTTSASGGEEPDENDGLSAPHPSDPFALVKDVYAIMGTFADWDTARRAGLEAGSATPGPSAA